MKWRSILSIRFHVQGLVFVSFSRNVIIFHDSLPIYSHNVKDSKFLRQKLHDNWTIQFSNLMHTCQRNCHIFFPSLRAAELYSVGCCKSTVFHCPILEQAIKFIFLGAKCKYVNCISFPCALVRVFTTRTQWHRSKCAVSNIALPEPNCVALDKRITYMTLKSINHISISK